MSESSRPSDGGSEAAIALERLCVTRGGLPVLRDLTATAAVGRITGLLGPSGSGKTTLMRAVMGVQRVTSGSVRVLGRPAGDPALRRIVSYVSQSPSVYRDLTVAQNIRYFGSLYGLSRAQADRSLVAVGLEDFADRLMSRLSGGQQGRVSLACALVASPALIVLDEPTTGLDPVLREDLWALFRRMAQAGATLLVSSHVMDEAERCDRLLLLRDGAIIADDTPSGLRTRTGTSSLDAAFLALVEAGAR